MYCVQMDGYGVELHTLFVLAYISQINVKKTVVYMHLNGDMQ